jgi:hypothetical protein
VELTLFTVIVVIRELTVVTLTVLGRTYFSYSDIAVSGAYCSYCDNGDRGSLH